LGSDKGYTLVELLVTMALLAILLTLSAGALRHYWWAQTIDGAGEEVVSQLRQVQERTRSEGYPLAYAVRFEVGTRNWAIVRYDAKSATMTDDDECTVDSTRTLAEGVTISAASFDPPGGIVLSKCPGSTQAFAVFNPRGTATGGSVTLTQAATGRTRTITVLALTGRVSES
jgi:prepilin-type N-terminal cleavage/methylation domain-containing protein